MSGFYIGVDGKARKVKGGYVGLDGVARKIKKGYIGVDGVARLCYSDVTFDPVFANNTWEDVIVACQNNAVPDTWSVGDRKKMNIGGTDYVVDIIGKNHDDYSDGKGKAPLTFQLGGCLSNTYNMNRTNTNAGGWDTCYMRTTTLKTILSTMPDVVKNNIRDVKKPTSQGNKLSNIIYSNDKLFLLSEKEVTGTSNTSMPNEGNIYEFYSNGGSKIKSINGVARYWFLRSPNKSTSEHFLTIDYEGNVDNSYASNGFGVSFAFCF